MITEEMKVAAESAYLKSINELKVRKRIRSADEDLEQDFDDAMRAALEAVVPMIRSAAIEEAAKVADNLKPVGWDYPARGYEIARAIRALAPSVAGGERE